MNLKPGFEKYIPFTPQPIEGRTWPDKVITKATNSDFFTPPQQVHL